MNQYVPNIDGLLHKMAEIRNFLFTTKVDILAITKTHLDLSIDREHIEMMVMNWKEDTDRTVIMIKYLSYGEELSSITKQTGK